MASYNDQLLDVVDKFQEEHPGPFTLKQVAAFGLNTGQIKPHQGKLLSIVAEEISRAMREQYIKDPQNRTVRAKHVARLVVEGEQRACGTVSTRLSRGSCRWRSSSAANRSWAIASSSRLTQTATTRTGIQGNPYRCAWTSPQMSRS